MNAVDESQVPAGEPQHAELDDVSKLAKVDYVALKERLSFRPNLLIVILTLAINQGLLALGLWLLSLGTVPAYLLSQLIFPIVFFQAFSVLHDCGHGSCTSRSWLNSLIGHYMSVWCFIPFFPWKQYHALHHTWTGNVDKDPTLAMLRAWRATQRVPLAMRIAWRSWIPLGAAMVHVVLWSHPITVWRTNTGAQLRRCIVSVVWLAASWAGLHHAWPELFALRNFALAIVVYLVGVELVNLPHHSDQRTTSGKLALWEQGFSTRSCYYPNLVSELLVLNFNFHIEHHLFPTLPWYRLRGARALIKPALGNGYNEAIGISWNLKHRSTDITKVLRARGAAD